MRVVAATAAAVVLLGACAGAARPSPVELAERHIQCHNEGDVAGFRAAFAEDGVIGEIGTATHPDVVEAVAFQLGSVQGTDGFVATCVPWGDDGATCEGFVYDRVASPAGLTRHLTLAYQFNSEGEIIRLGQMDIYDHQALNQYSRELAAWVASSYPELAPLVTEYGHIKKTGAEAIELLIPLAEEFIAQSNNWPLPPPTSTG